MSIEWRLSDAIQLGGVTDTVQAAVEDARQQEQIAPDDAVRQERTARRILDALREQPGIVLADEVGMGKTYVALAVMASVLEWRGRKGAPIVVMLPPGLLEKWRREWKNFRATCCRPGQFDWVRDPVAHEALDFVRLVSGEKRADVVWMTTTCFSREYRDPWVELAMIRWVLGTMRLSESSRAAIYKWTPRMIKKGPRSGLTSQVMELLLRKPHADWQAVLVREGVLSEEADALLPPALLKARIDASQGENWRSLREFLRNEVPGYKGAPSDSTLERAGKKLRSLCRAILPEVLSLVPWNSPMLILDEAHHAKNDSTKLAGLFRSHEFFEKGEDAARPRLLDRFDRMLFLTATPFQLGHGELIRILRSFAAANWGTSRAPVRSREDFLLDIEKLADRLSEGRAAARNLDRAWGSLTPELIGNDDTAANATEDEDQRLYRWWQSVESQPRNELERNLVECVSRCRQTRDAAERDPQRPWAALQTWVLRSNRPIALPRPPWSNRRVLHIGGSITGAGINRNEGLPLTPDVALPFLLSARAQGEMAAASDKPALFAQGLASSYEAFHHTREENDVARVIDPEVDALGSAAESVSSAPNGDSERSWAGVPIEWYLDQIQLHIPSRAAPRQARYLHPKVRATVDRAVDLWARGEKVLVFCFYIETVAALGEHIAAAIEQKTYEIAAERLGLRVDLAEKWIKRATRNIARKDSLLRREIEREIHKLIGQADPLLKAHEARVVAWLSAYVRTPSFLVRNLPLGNAELRAAFDEGQTGANVFERAANSVSAAMDSKADASGQTFRQKVTEFLRFAADLAERARFAPSPGDEEEDAVDPLEDYFAGIERHRDSDADDAGTRVTLGGGRTPRISEVVRIAHGGTGKATRERLMWAFNSPIFPEVLVSSRILSEGVDLHRFCRYVIHHDMDWNPSVLEQRNGRVDRIRCKAETTNNPIEIFQPFIAGGADEKMFRVVKDRERWFQIVMGQDFKLDEATTEKLARRVPLPAQLAGELLFRLGPS